MSSIDVGAHSRVVGLQDLWVGLKILSFYDSMIFLFVCLFI